MSALQPLLFPLIRRCAVGPWTGFTPVLNSASSVGAGTLVGRYRRVAGSCEIEWTASLAAGLSIVSYFALKFPTDILPDFAALGFTQAAPGVVPIGRASGLCAGNRVTGQVAVGYNTGVSEMRILKDSDGSIWTATVPGTFAIGDYISVQARFPVVGWS